MFTESGHPVPTADDVTAAVAKRLAHALAFATAKHPELLDDIDVAEALHSSAVLFAN